MQEVLDAVSARIKAPYFGYALLAFIGLNWRGIFFLSVMKGSPQERLAAFDAHTSAWSLVVLPLLAGGIVTVISPWVRLGFGLLSRLPFEHVDNLHLDSEHKRTIRKTQLEKSRSEFFASKESELIERAKRDERVAEIEDEKLKEKLRRELDALRRERDELSVDLAEQKSRARVSEEGREILKAAAQDKTGTVMKRTYIGGQTIQAGGLTFGEASNREFAKYDAALRDLVSNGLVSAVGGRGELFELTHAGWQFADEL